MVLIGLTALGALLRFMGLDLQPLAHDEMSSVVRSAHASLWTVIEQGVRPDVHPPGFQALLYVVERWWGDGALHVRFLSALGGVAAIPALAWVGAMLAGWRVGLGAAALLSVSWTAVYYSQEARAYSLLMMAVILATGCWLRLQQAEAGRRAWIWCGLYVLAGTFCAYVHYFGLLIIVLQVGWLVVRAALRRGPVAPMVVAPALLLIAYAPWLPIFAEQLRGRSSFWIDRPEGLAATLLELLLFSFGESFVLVALVLGVAVVALGAAAWRMLRGGGGARARDRKLIEPCAILVMLAWLLVPFILVYLRSVTATPVLTMRNLIVVVPAIYLLLAYALSWLPGRGRGYSAAVVALVVILGAHLLLVKDYYGRISKLQARDAVAAVVAHEDPDDVSVLSVGISPAYVRYQLRQQDDRFDVEMGDRKVKAAEIPGLFRRLLDGEAERAWVLCLQRPPTPMLVAGTYAALDIEHTEGLYFAAAWGGAINPPRLRRWLGSDLRVYRTIRQLRPADDTEPIDRLRVPSFLPGNPGPLPVYLARGGPTGVEARISVGQYRHAGFPRAVFYALCETDRRTDLVVRAGPTGSLATASKLPAGSWRWVFAVFDREELVRQSTPEIRLTAPDARRLYFRLAYLVPVP